MCCAPASQMHSALEHLLALDAGLLLLRADGARLSARCHKIQHVISNHSKLECPTALLCKHVSVDPVDTYGARSDELDIYEQETLRHLDILYGLP